MASYFDDHGVSHGSGRAEARSSAGAEGALGAAGTAGQQRGRGRLFVELMNRFASEAGVDVAAADGDMASLLEMMNEAGMVNVMESMVQRAGGRAPPAGASAIKHELVDVEIGKGHVDMGAVCAICADEYCVGQDAKRLPCKHFFHTDCILQWLGLSNSCPSCRFEIETDDAAYEAAKREKKRKEDAEREMHASADERRKEAPSFMYQ